MSEKLTYFLIFIFLFTACNSSVEKTPEESEITTATSSDKKNYPTYFMEVLQAHGGIDRWNKWGTMQYQLTSDGNTETHIIDLKNRKDLVKADNYTIGYDGEQVWVSPDKAAYPGGSARFYHNLYFYFHAIPFVLADPGVSYEQMEDMTLQGESYNVIGVTFGDGVGDSPEDKYRLLINPETNRMEWLLYTVTYFDGKPTDKFNALKYEDYKEYQGLLFPQKLTGHKFENGEIGEARYSATFESVQLREEQPEQRQFEMPEKAEVDSMAH